MRLHPEQLGVFDPSYLLCNVAAAVRFLVGGEKIADVPLVDGTARATWRVPQTVPDFHEVFAELRVDDRPVDVMRCGFAVWNPARAGEGHACRYAATSRHPGAWAAARDPRGRGGGTDPLRAGQCTR